MFIVIHEIAEAEYCFTLECFVYIIGLYKPI